MDYYEIGKWSGDRVGFPRFGIVNKELQLIKDTFEFLSKTSENKLVVEIQHRKGVSVSKQRIDLAKFLGISTDRILITENNYMRGRYAYRVFTLSRKLFRVFQNLSDEILFSSEEGICKFLAGFADAEATVDTRNMIISYSISNKKRDEAERIRLALEKVLKVPIRIRTAGKLELKIEVPSSGMNIFISKIGRFIKHPEKICRMNGRFVSEKDKAILDFINSYGMKKAKEIAVEFNVHPDSARRILRSFRRQGLIK